MNQNDARQTEKTEFVIPTAEIILFRKEDVEDDVIDVSGTPGGFYTSDDGAE